MPAGWVYENYGKAGDGIDFSGVDWNAVDREKAEFIFREAMDKKGYAGQASQFFAALTNVRTVGVTNDERTYGYVVCLRAVQTLDFMTAKVVPLPIEFLVEVSGEIATKVEGVNRVVYDITNKPPATIEWE